MGFAELFEIGFFTAFINWSNWWLSALIYACAAGGFALQYFLLKKCRRAAARYWTDLLDAVGILFSEAWWHTVTGWDRLAVDIVYGFFVCLLIGHLIALPVFRIRSGKVRSEEEAQD